VKRPIVIVGRAPEAVDVALRHVLRFKEVTGPLVIADWIGRGAPLLSGDNEGQLAKRPVTWCDLASRQRPTGVFALRASDRLHSALSAILHELREVARTPVKDDVLAWAADVGVRLADEGTIGLSAWYQALIRPDVRRWFPAAPVTADARDAVARLLGWALRFSGVYAVSEGPNRIDSSGMFRKTATTWIEMPFEHFEPIEYKLVALLVDIALKDALASVSRDPKDADEIPTLLEIFPTYALPNLGEWLKASAGGTRHIAVFALATERPLGKAFGAWMEAGADLWVVGGARLRPAALAPWLDEATRRRLSGLHAGDLWARSGATTRAVVVKVRRPAPLIPLPWRFRLQSLRRRRPSAVAQMATALGRGGRRAGSLYDRLCDPTLLRAAWLRVAQGKADSHGVDGVSIARFRSSLDRELGALAEDLALRQYRTRPLRTVLIPKPSGGTRGLRISCIRDRIVQTACLSVLEPIFESAFSQASFAFRPRRNAHQAVALARSFIAGGHAWAVIADIEKCFDRLDHDVLMERVARRVADPLLLALLRHWLTADVLDFRDLVPLEVGVPQGSPVSPLLANVYLDPLDRHLEELRIDFVRYADDMVLFARDETKAVDALQTLERFLREPLRLELKPAKTNYVRIADNVDFLGFRLTDTAITIQPETLDRVTSSLHASLIVLGAGPTSFLERARTLTRMNALIRGFRNYFALPGEAAVGGQLRDLDRRIDLLGEEHLPESFRRDPAWAARERFLLATADADDDAVMRRTHDVYPEEREASLPTAWMVKRDEKEETGSIVASAGPPPTRTADETPPSPHDIVQHEGRVYVTTHGSYVTEAGGALVVKRRKQEIYRHRLDGISLVFLQGLGTSVSLSLALECARRDVAVVVAPPVGAPVAVLNPIDSTRSHLRGRQVLRRNDPDVVRCGLRMLAAKVANQASVLRYFAKYRAKTDVDVYKRLVAASDDVRQLARRATEIDPVHAGVRATAMGFEGHAAAIYWTHLALLLPAGIGFRGRVTRDASDPVNQCINYVYGMLYGEVWRALVRAGLDPYFGIMHGSERDHGSLVFDLIEEFRAPFADRVVVALVSRGLKIETSEDSGLRSRVRRVLARTFIRSWTRAVHWRGHDTTPAGVLDRQAGALVKLFNGDGDYRPFRMRW